jgi:hypothetical protein
MHKFILTSQLLSFFVLVSQFEDEYNLLLRKFLVFFSPMSDCPLNRKSEQVIQFSISNNTRKYSIDVNARMLISTKLELHYKAIIFQLNPTETF